MLSLTQAALAAHIGAGSVALITGAVAMMVRKGSRPHRRAGQIYFVAMTIVALTALVLSLLKANLFLGAIGVFSFYLVAGGYRALARKRGTPDASELDWLLTAFGAIAGIVLVVLGISQQLQGRGLVAVVLGTLAVVLATVDGVRLWRNTWEDMSWWYTHMARMLGAYISTVTAVSVVNLRFLPDNARWLWPTVVGTIAITVWVRYYKRRFAGRKQAHAVRTAA